MMKKMLLLVLLTGSFWGCRERPLAVVDQEFDATVLQPTYSSNRPRLLFDEGHNNLHTTRGTYQPFVTLLTNDGAVVTATAQPITESSVAVRLTDRLATPVRADMERFAESHYSVVTTL
ncbi:hypothetical protein [Hymenobacter sp. BT730]|uniref:hypothetical protein n=1 Tax=Hymenobacter sp. BT730 TaxID=3063332 RepID=UPI0026E0784E|nr:hypothetical protein [Hymenobacter sp. BT730]